MKNAITERKVSIECSTADFGMAEEMISHLKGGSIQMILPEKQKGKTMKKNEQNLKDLLDAIKHINICIITEVPEGKRERKDQKNI